MFNNIKQLIKKDSRPLTPYDKMGGELAIKKLVDRFYFYMDTLPEAKSCRGLHSVTLGMANKKLSMFLSGWLGGPSLYISEFGHPKMRKRHMPFAIGARNRDEWLLCMREALNDLELETELDFELWQSFRRFAEHMRNQES